VTCITTKCASAVAACQQVPSCGTDITGYFNCLVACQSICDVFGTTGTQAAAVVACKKQMCAAECP
jgi:hypothetical protein